MTHRQRIEQYIAEGRTVSGAKGDATDTSTEKSTSEFAQQLQQAFAANNASQSNDFAFLNKKIQTTLNNPQGFSPATLAAMRAQANDAVASQTQNSERAANTFETRGGSGLPSGVNAQINAEIAQQAGQEGNQAQANITEENAALENQNYNTALGAEENVAQLENPEGMAGESNHASGEVASLANAETAASGPTFGSILGNTIGTVGSVAVGKAMGH